MVINACLVVVCSELKFFFFKKKYYKAVAALLSFCFAKESSRKQAIKNN